MDVPLTVFMERLRGARLLTIAHSLPPWSVSEPFAKRAPENRAQRLTLRVMRTFSLYGCV